MKQTPFIRIGNIYTKLECVNPTGSIKDRIAQYIIDESERQGILKPGMEIIEATSGNTGIALSFYAKQKGYPITIVMPENMTEERKDIITNLEAKLILCSKEGSFTEAARIRDQMAKENPNYFNPDQFSNPLNVECHYQTTGKEILKQIKEYTNKPTDSFVAGVGTGGTLIGVAKALQKANPNIHIAAVEPAESAVMSGGIAGEHDIQGIGDGFIPAIASDGNSGLNEIIDEVISITSNDAKQASEFIRKMHGYCVGISSGANYLAAKALQKDFDTIVTIFPDGFEKYQSQGLRHCTCPYEKLRVNVLSRRQSSPDKNSALARL